MYAWENNLKKRGDIWRDQVSVLIPTKHWCRCTRRKSCLYHAQKKNTPPQILQNRSFWYPHTSVGRFSTPDPVLDTVLRLVLTVRTGWHGWLRKLDGEPTSGSHMNEDQLWKPVLFIFYFLFWRIEQVLLENLHPVLDSLGFKVFKQPSPPSEVDALFRVRDKKSV